MVRIVTDSSCDMSPALAAELNVEILPANILFGRVKYSDGVNITPREFYDKLATEYFHPVTTPASPLQFYRVFREIEDMGEDILMIALPEKLSGFQVSARLAASHITKVKVHILNSGGISGFQSILIIQAVKLVERGFTLEEIVQRLEELKKSVKFFALVPSFDQLIRSGRVPSVKGRVGGLLGVFPLLTMEDDMLETVATPRGFNTGFEFILNDLLVAFSKEEPLICIILDGFNPTWASQLEKLVLNEFNIKEIIYAKVGPTIGANSGPGTVGIAIAPIVRDLL